GAQAPKKEPEKKAVPALRIVPPMAVQQPAIPDQQFDLWVFQFQQDRTAAAARQRLDSLLTLQVEDIDRACKLADLQKKKLQLSGRGDIKRFFDRYEAVKQRFNLLKHDQQKMNEIFQETRPLSMTLQAGLFHNGSLLYRSLHNTLTDE